MRDIESAGLVERLPHDPRDRRRGGFAVTPAGRRMLDDAKQRWTGWLAGRLLDLPEDGRAAMAAALPHLRHMSAPPSVADRR
jgi:DNA-binding MarR family transcriptional regulator